MVWLIIAVALALIIAPIVAVMPSARQKAQMKMRQAAMDAGVTVAITMIDDPQRDRRVSRVTGKPLTARLQVAGYRLQRRRGENWRQQPQVQWCLERKPEAGDTVGQFAATLFPREAMSARLVEYLEREVPSLPADVQKVEEVAFTITVYWHEREPGSEQDVVRFLKGCAGVPLHRAIQGGQDNSPA